MAQELITVETRAGHDVNTDQTIFTPAVGEKVHVLFVLFHAMQQTSSGAFEIIAGSTILAEFRNDSTNPVLPDQSSTTAIGTFIFDSTNTLDPFKIAQIKIPTPPDSAGTGLITDTLPLKFGKSSTGARFVTTSVWVIRET